MAFFGIAVIFNKYSQSRTLLNLEVEFLSEEDRSAQLLGTYWFSVSLSEEVGGSTFLARLFSSVSQQSKIIQSFSAGGYLLFKLQKTQVSVKTFQQLCNGVIHCSTTWKTYLWDWIYFWNMKRSN